MMFDCGCCNTSNNEQYNGQKKGLLEQRKKSVYYNRRFYLIIVCTICMGNTSKLSNSQWEFFFSSSISPHSTKRNNITTDDIIIRWSGIFALLLLCRAIFFYLFPIFALIRNHRPNRSSENIQFYTYMAYVECGDGQTNYNVLPIIYEWNCIGLQCEV